MDVTVLLLVLVAVPVHTIFVDNSQWVSNAVNEKGYPCEVHSVISPDGYVLVVHRIPRGPSQNSTDSNEKRPVVLLQHGIGASSSQFVIGPTSSALGFLLVDSGFDVWLPNNRGNLFSEKHVNMTNLNPDYWNFSFEELAVKDLPVILEYILDQTGQQHLSYVGHSLGCTIFFALMSTKPELNSRIKVMVGMAPATFTARLPSPLLRLIAPFFELIEKLLNNSGIYGVPYNSFLSMGSSIFCGISKDAENICQIIFSILNGFDPQQWNTDWFLISLETYPAGFSLRSLRHLFQLVMSAKFRRFDFGPERNEIIYRQSSPPDYDLTKVTAPVAIFYGTNDWFIHPEDVSDLARTLPNLIGLYEVKWPFFNHLDFLSAKNVVPLVYENVLRVLLNHV